MLAVLLSNPDASLLGQLAGIVVIFAWMFGAGMLVWLAIKHVMGIRVSEEVEYEGLDVTDCGMSAYPEFVDSEGAK